MTYHRVRLTRNLSRTELKVGLCIGGTCRIHLTCCSGWYVGGLQICNAFSVPGYNEPLITPSLICKRKSGSHTRYFYLGNTMSLIHAGNRTSSLYDRKFAFSEIHGTSPFSCYKDVRVPQPTNKLLWIPKNFNWNSVLLYFFMTFRQRKTTINNL